MHATRRLWISVAVVVLAALALLGFYVWLVGGSAFQGSSGEDTQKAGDGIVPVRSIYTYAGDENIVRPVGIGADDKGGFFVTLLDSGRIVEFDSSGDYVRHWGERGTNPGNLLAPTSVAVYRLANHVYVIDRSRLKLIAYATDGTYLWEVPVLNPVSVAVDPDGQVAVATFGPIATFTSEGEILGQAGSRGPDAGQFDYPRQVAFDADGVAYVADANNARVQAVRLEGDVTATVLWVAGTRPLNAEDIAGRFGLPTGVAVTRDGRPVVLDSFRHTISLLDPKDGELVNDFGGERRGAADGLLELPTNIAHLSGDLFAISDTGNDRIQIVRLVAPEDQQIWNLYPMLRWLGLLPLLLLASVFGRKRRFVTDAALKRAIDEGNARLLLSATKRPFALPDTIERYGQAVEADVMIGEHLRAAAGAAGPIETADERLAQAAQLSVVQRMLIRRHIVVCADAEQCASLEREGFKTLEYERIVENYSLKD
ncbi:MAG: NHL repeat-containing protein [Coriobacteriia bacterium]|nr:NHL repeat-containing protein [Coriobacteriia bacterium]